MLSKSSVKSAALSLYGPSQRKKIARFLLTWILAGLAGLASSIYLTGTFPEEQAAAAEGADPANSVVFSGFSTLPAQDVNRQVMAGQDIVVIFDISGSMEDQTICHDCWVRTSFGPDYPSNGYFNPLPYNPSWATVGTINQSIPFSPLCSEPPSPYITSTITGTFQYLVVEAELYSAKAGDWNLAAHTPGQGFWAIQRGSHRSGSGFLGEPDSIRPRNQAGIPAQQSSNVCNPNVPGIDCTVGINQDNVCSSTDGGIAVDCSAYLAARPFQTYDQTPGNTPGLSGAAYNADCFLPGPGPHPVPPFSTHCWGPATNPFFPLTGYGPGNVPWVEYDFTPTWSGNTTIWIRAIGGGALAYTWAGDSPDQLAPDLNGGGVENNITSWSRVIYWQVNNGQVHESSDPDLNECCANADEWRDNRAETPRWRWIKLGSLPTVSGVQSTLKLYQGSAGYKIDKIIFTNDNSGSTGAPPATMLLDYPLGVPANQRAVDVGPPASEGSATREACNFCNPAFGYTVNPGDCSCRLGYSDLANAGYGSGTGCTTVLSRTNQLADDLYSGLQPLRSAQEAVKKFVQGLNPQCHQLGLVAFTDEAESSNHRRSKLQCLSWASAHLGGVGGCYDASFETPISYTQVMSAVERQWPTGKSDIAEGLREGLEELGIPPYALDNSCSPTLDDGRACSRSFTQRVMILLTDGIPDDNPGNCAPGDGRPDLWNGLLHPDDDNFECAMYFAREAANKNVTLHIVGLGPTVNADLLTAMATGVDPGTNTTYFTGRGGQYLAAATPADLEAIFHQLLAQVPDCGSTPTTGPNGEQIWSVTGYLAQQNQNSVIHLESHLNDAGPYDIYLGNTGSSSYKICSAVNTQVTNSGDFECFINLTVPPGLYDLYSTLYLDLNPLAFAQAQVEIQANTGPQIVINEGTAGNLWAVNSEITLSLLAHQIPAQPFNLYFEYGGSQLLITGPITATPPPLSWRIPDTIGDPCPSGGVPCKLRTRPVSNLASIYAETNLYLNQPQIILADGLMNYFPGDMIHIYLGGHTPGVAYDLKLSDGNSHTIWLGRTEPINSLGETINPISGFIPPDWPAGLYTLTSHPAVGEMPRDPATMTGANRIALLEDVELATTGDAYLTVTGGYIWPANSLISINLHQHQPHTSYYLKFGPWQVPTPANDDSFQTNVDGTATITYRIPLTATGNISTTIPISSFLAATHELISARNVIVWPTPLLQLAQLDTPDPVMAGQTLTYTLAVTNIGSAAATSILITDTLPHSVTFASASQGGIHHAGVVTWQVNILPFNQAVTRTLMITVGNIASGTILSNTAWITSSEGISHSHLATTTVFTGPTSLPSSIYLPTLLKDK